MSVEVTDDPQHEALARLRKRDDCERFSRFNSLKRLTLDVAETQASEPRAVVHRLLARSAEASAKVVQALRLRGLTALGVCALAREATEHQVHFKLVHNLGADAERVTRQLVDLGMELEAPYGGWQVEEAMPGDVVLKPE